jgi:hypothetical protein
MKPKNGKILGYFLLKLIFYVFTQINSLKIWFVEGIFSFKKGFDLDVAEF